jgi:ABC-type antimicrobial peptide transport system permease subunit
MRDVDPEYFDVMDVPLADGSLFDRSTPQNQILIDERFAARYWPGESPIGARFMLGKGVGLGGVHEFEVLGVTRQQLSDRLATDDGDEVYVAHIRLSWNPMKFVAKVESVNRLDDLGDLVRSVAGRSVVRVDTADNRYQKLHAEERLGAAVTTGFGVTALIVSTAGVFAVCAFIVSVRSRELAIRMALGAGASSVMGLVLRSSLGPVVLGVAAGLGTAAVVIAASASAWVGAQSVGVGVYVSTGVLLASAAILAALVPAFRAVRLDPVRILRSE